VKIVEAKRQTTTHGRRDHARLSNKPDGDSVISEIEEDSSLLRTKKTSELELAKSVSEGKQLARVLVIDDEPINTDVIQ